MDNDPSHPPLREGVRRSEAVSCLTCTILKSPIGGFRGSYYRNCFFIFHIISVQLIFEISPYGRNDGVFSASVLGGVGWRRSRQPTPPKYINN